MEWCNGLVYCALFCVFCVQAPMRATRASLEILAYSLVCWRLQSATSILQVILPFIEENLTKIWQCFFLMSTNKSKHIANHNDERWRHYRDVRCRVYNLHKTCSPALFRSTVLSLGTANFVNEFRSRSVNLSGQLFSRLFEEKYFFYLEHAASITILGICYISAETNIEIRCNHSNSQSVVSTILNTRN